MDLEELNSLLEGADSEWEVLRRLGAPVYSCICGQGGSEAWPCWEVEVHAPRVYLFDPNLSKQVDSMVRQRFCSEACGHRGALVGRLKLYKLAKENVYSTANRIVVARTHVCIKR